MSFLLGEEDKNYTGKEAPSISLFRLDNNKYFRSKNYIEKEILVVSFFATWCEPCIKEIRELQLLKEQYANKPVQFFLIDLTEYFRKGEERKYNKAKKAAPFLKELNLAKIPILEDNRGIVADKYGVSNNIPRLFVIDKYQTIQFDGANECPTCIQDLLIPILDKLIDE